MIVAVGLSHRTAAVREREKAALDEAGARALLRDVRALPELWEAAVLPTCNRTELYGAGPEAALVAQRLREALPRHTAIEPAQAAAITYERSGADALRHLFRVAAGLDSMVVGESEIQGQVRRAMRIADEEAMLGLALRRAFRQALVTGKLVRSRTRVGERPVSVASVAVSLAVAAFGDLSGCEALIVGAGRTGGAVSRALRGRGVRRLTIANRSPDAAARLAAEVGARAVTLPALGGALERADLVVCSTDATAPVLSRRALERAGARRHGRPLLVLDLAVPRDVDPAAAALPGVTLHDLDDLEDIARANHLLRHDEALRAESLVAAEVARLAPPARERLVA